MQFRGLVSNLLCYCVSCARGAVNSDKESKTNLLDDTAGLVIGMQAGLSAGAGRPPTIIASRYRSACGSPLLLALPPDYSRRPVRETS